MTPFREQMARLLGRVSLLEEKLATSEKMLLELQQRLIRHQQNHRPHNLITGQ